jgi:hypothetical protein
MRSLIWLNKENRMKKIIGFLSLLALLLTGCGSTIPQPPAAQPVVPLPTAVIDAASYPTVQAPQINNNLSVSGFSVDLKRAWRDGKQVYADVCFTLPDTSDWTIWVAHLDYTGQTNTQFSSSMLSKQDAANGQPGQRCDELGFYVAPDADLSSASVTIESLGAPPAAGEYCSLYMPKIQQTLTERGIAISLDCADVNGVATMRIASKPDSMSDADAQKIVYSDEFYTVKGPWTFQVSLGQ